MLNKLGVFVTEKRWWIVLTWVIVSIGIIALSPSLSSVSSSNETGFLPSKYEAIKAQDVANKAFPKSQNDTEIIFITRSDNAKLTSSNKQFIYKTAKQLQDKHLNGVSEFIASPESVSKDGSAQLVQVMMTSQVTGTDTDVSTIKDIRSAISEVFSGSGLQASLTGQMAIDADTSSSFKSAEKIVTGITLLLVILLPALIFRSPVAAFVPVVAVGLVYSLSQAIIALVAKKFNFQISNQLSILYTVVLFGIGTDYILFLLFRYRERLRAGKLGRKAVAFALSRAGEAILSAALVVAAAFAVLSFSQFGIFKNLAPGLVICVLVMLAAVLTLIPALITIIGPKIFWPSKAWQKPPKPTVSKKVGGLVAKKPLRVATMALLVLVLLGIGCLHLKIDYNTLNQLPTNAESTKTYQKLGKTFAASVISPTQIYFVAGKTISPAIIQKLTQDITTKKNVTLAGEPQLSADGKTLLETVYLPGQPYSTSTLNYIKDSFRPSMHGLAAKHNLTAYVGGESAAFVDVRSVVNRDLSVVLPIAAGIIFLILFVLLRSLLAPLYLLITVALGFAATLGGTSFLFQNVLDKPGLIFFIPIMVYLFVVAIGTDYNILTMTRLREEVREGNPPHKAADLTVEHSANTVASAGLILAGTFGSLCLAGLSILSQLGFAIAFGIVLAAFVMAPLIVPSVSSILGYKVWWPGHRPSRKD